MNLGARSFVTTQASVQQEEPHSFVLCNTLILTLRPNPHWTRAYKFAGNSFDVACIQHEHSNSKEQVSFACIFAYTLNLSKVGSKNKRKVNDHHRSTLHT